VRKVAEEAALAKKSAQAAQAEAKVTQSAAEHAATASETEAGSKLNDYGTPLNESVASSGAVGAHGDLVREAYRTSGNALIPPTDAGTSSSGSNPTLPIKSAVKMPEEPGFLQRWFGWGDTTPDAGTLKDRQFITDPRRMY
jgi:hypothetical protein